jgi:hypothetical protein
MIASLDREFSDFNFVRAAFASRTLRNDPRLGLNVFANQRYNVFANHFIVCGDMPRVNRCQISNGI